MFLEMFFSEESSLTIWANITGNIKLILSELERKGGREGR